jgi:hypothetical protein
MKAEFTVFEDADGYWFVPHCEENAAIADPSSYRVSVHATKIAACRMALLQAIETGATELHLHGFGSTTGIKREATLSGLTPFIYWPSITTRIAPFMRAKKA